MVGCRNSALARCLGCRGPQRELARLWEDLCQRCIPPRVLGHLRWQRSASVRRWLGRDFVAALHEVVTHTSNGGPKWQVSCHEREETIILLSVSREPVSPEGMKGNSVRQTYFFFLPNQPPPFFAGDAPAGLFAFLDGFLAFPAALADHASASSAASSCAAADSASASCFFRIASL